ncbi:high frequency lysogenization protein HflD [Nitrosopumilus sp. b3]|uniref:urease accessory protein UreH domain-containing protein n=1 Tax=Nitrosopumilus sp. b3 TaxID=2109909 RepID=UPI001CE8FE2A|nr:sulfite exporter TauE/SafE family protein [Nitrosopumilus sp. b3]KAF6246247.1 high frequency lysogenization protein HflD [Nitrosopumilus sp. b3]
MIEEILDQIGIISPILVMGLGLVVGIQHAFEPDHMSAVSTQISKSKLMKISSKQLIRESITKSSLLGAVWGAGHTTTLVLIGFLTYVLAITIQDQIFLGLEIIVGVMLVFLGVTTILNKKIQFKHKHPHQHKDGTLHLDEHDHDDFDHRHTHKSYLIGLIHGLAGSGSFVVLTAATLDNVEMVLSFILIFGIGSMIGMALVGSLMGIPLVFASKIGIIQKTFRYVAGIFSLIIGFNIMYQIGIVENLFRF